jgi:hypothetical protein
VDAVLSPPSEASTMCVSRFPAGSAVNVFWNSPMLSVCAVVVRSAKCSSGSEIVIVIAVLAGNPLPEIVTSSSAW